MAFHNRHRSAPTQQDFHSAIARGSGAWYGACLRITKDAGQAQDAVQDALLSAWSKRDQFHAEARLETWIHRIAVNAALALVRRRRAFAPDDPDALPGLEPTPAEVHGQHELNRDLQVALNGLSDMERVCFVLKHIEQWRLAEIASELDTGVGPVKQALFRAVRKLRSVPTLEAMRQ